jgi:hypothetical protein
VVLGELPVADDVDVRLRELPEPAVLGTLAPPHLLDLVATEREGDVAGVLDHPARERDGEVEVQSQLSVGLLGARLGLEAAEQVDLLGGLPLAQQLRDRLDGPRLDGREAVELERASQRVQDMVLHDPPLGEPLGEAGQ